MKKVQLMSDSEKKIMEFIWHVGQPVTTAEIMQKLPEAATWNQKTVITFLSRLIKKGLLQATRISKANHYEPCLTEAEYLAIETKMFIKNVHKGSLFGFINALCDAGDLTKEEIEALLKRLKEQED